MASRRMRFTAEQVADLVFEEGCDNDLDDLITMDELLEKDKDQLNNSITSNVEEDNFEDDCSVGGCSPRKRERTIFQLNQLTSSKATQED